ncbi:MAG TPA: tyrosine-type recombinase/integrase [Pseudogracilibacillus sp.]|nr:tyrosine-type recombinase/integrase [Pseudogracilibacillus sp.]
MKLHKTKENEVYYYFLKNGEKRFMYRHKYVDVLGKRKEKKKSGFKTEKEALRGLLEVKATLLDGNHNFVDNNQLTVSQWLEIWFETYGKEWKPTTIRQRKSIIDKHIKPLLGTYKLSTLNRATYTREFINKLSATKLKKSTISFIHDIFKIAINAAVEDEIIPRNRFTKITFEKEKKLDNFLSPKELRFFLNYTKIHCNITSYTVMFLLAYTGLRKGEALGLKWKNISFDNKSITVESTRDKNGLRSPKTTNSYRTIAVDNLLIKQLKKYQVWCIEKKFQNGVNLDKKEDLIFISYKDGEPVNDYYLNDSFKLLYKKIKLNGQKLKRITPHGLRHTHATILISNGVAPPAIAKRLGNTVQMIYEVYTHCFDELEEQAVDAFSQSL